MKYLKRKHQQLIEWLKFDPLNPVCEFDPRTGEHLKWLNASIYNGKCRKQREIDKAKGFEYNIGIKTFLRFISKLIGVIFHYSCQRIYYIIKFRKLKIGLEDYYTY